MITRSIAGVLLITMLPQLAACTSWRVQPVAPAPALRETEPRDALVRLRRDGRIVMIPEARIIGDSIVGYQESAPFYLTPHCVAIPLGDVQDLAIRHVNTGRTVLAVVAATGVALGLKQMFR